MRRRTLLIAGTAGIAAVAGAVPLTGRGGIAPAWATAWDPQITDFDRILGSGEAPVTVIEYASLTCGHCAAFYNHTFPQVKSNYIDQGRVRFVYRDFPLDGVALRAAMLARCVPADRFFGVIEILFASQEQWAMAQDPVQALGRIGRLAGLSEDEFNACMANRDLAARIAGQREDAERRYGVDATPTFIVNGETVSGALSYDQFSAVLDRHAADR